MFKTKLICRFLIFCYFAENPYLFHMGKYKHEKGSEGTGVFFILLLVTRINNFNTYR